MNDDVKMAIEIGSDEAISFLENACRNWSRVPKLSKDDVGDVARALTGIVRKYQPAALEQAGEPVAFQQRVQPWMMECFGETISGDMLERADRFTEEALELAQTMPGFSAERAHALVDYVFGRDVGERKQEVGGVMVTLAALCLAAGEDMHDAGETELARINQPHIVEKIRAKQAAKPTGSALPVASPMAEIQRLGQEFDAGEADAWRVDDLTAKGEVCDSFVIFTDHEKVEDHVRKYGQRHTKVTPLYAHPPQSRVAAEPVGLRDAEAIAGHAVARIDNFLAKFGGFEAYASLAENGTTTGWSQLRSTIWHAVKDAISATPSQPDPQSRGQAFDGEGEELAEAVRCIMARCEALEDEASNGIATTTANGRDEAHEAGFWRGQKSTAKSIREHLHDMTRAGLSEAREAGDSLAAGDRV